MMEIKNNASDSFGWYWSCWNFNFWFQKATPLLSFRRTRRMSAHLQHPKQGSCTRTKLQRALVGIDTVKQTQRDESNEILLKVLYRGCSHDFQWKSIFKCLELCRRRSIPRLEPYTGPAQNIPVLRKAHLAFDVGWIFQPNIWILRVWSRKCMQFRSFWRVLCLKSMLKAMLGCDKTSTRMIVEFAWTCILKHCMHFNFCRLWYLEFIGVCCRVGAATTV